MKRISTTSVLPFESVYRDEPVQAILHRLVANESYIVASFSGTNTVHFLSSRTGEVLRNAPYESCSVVSGLVLDGDNLIMTTSKSSSLIIYHIPSETVLCTLHCSDNKEIFILNSIYSDVDKCFIAAFHSDGSICIWDIRGRKHLNTIKPHDEIAPRCSVFGSQIITSSQDGTTAVSSWYSGEILWKKKLGEAEVWVEGSKGERGKWTGNAVYAQVEWEGKLAVATRNGTVHVFDLESGTQIVQWQAANAMIQKLVVYNNWLISISWGEMKIWSLERYDLLNTTRIFDCVVTHLALIAGTMICCGRDAAREGDRCGGIQGVKACILSSGDRENTIADPSVSLFYPPLRAAMGLAVLNNSRVAIGVLRGSWNVEIWQI